MFLNSVIITQAATYVAQTFSLCQMDPKSKILLKKIHTLPYIKYNTTQQELLSTIEHPTKNPTSMLYL